MTRYPCSPAPPETYPLWRDDTVRSALAPPSVVVLVAGGIAVAGGCAMSGWLMFAGALGVPPPVAVGGDARTAVFLAGLLVPGMVGVGVEVLLLARLRLVRQRRWLAALPFPFAHEGYLRAMAQENDEAFFELVLLFAGPIRLDEIAAVAESHGVGSTPRLQGASTVRLVSPSCDARREGSTLHASPTSYSNARLHRWFRDHAAPMLAELYRAHGLTGAEVEV
jgi:hypothetical protein